LVATLALYCGGCALSKGQTEISRSDETKPPLQSVRAKSSTPSLDNQSLEIQSPALPIDKQSDVNGIPKVDFKNFTYSVTKDLSKMIPSRTFKVVEGTYDFGKLIWVHPSFWCKPDFLLFIMDEYQAAVCRS
jgi:hypothetical protein